MQYLIIEYTLRERERENIHLIIIASIWFVGPFVTGLEYAADCKAEVVGKPEKAFFLSAVEEFQCQPNECIMIGDVIHFYNNWFLS